MGIWRNLLLVTPAWLLAFCVRPAGAQQQQGTISGTVTDRVSGTAIATVRVSLLNTNRSAVTNQQGRFSLQGVPVGTYQVQAAIIGYAAATNSANVAAGGTATVDFGLRQAARSLDPVTRTTPPGAQRAREPGEAITNNLPPPQIENP